MGKEIQVALSNNSWHAVSAAIGGGVNALAQAMSSGKVKSEDVLKAVATAYARAGASLTTTMTVNVGAEGMVSWAKDDSASEAMSNMLLSAAGTAVGFKAGEFGKSQVDKIWNSYSATMKSKPTGFLTIEGPYSRSIVPSTVGNITRAVPRKQHQDISKITSTISVWQEQSSKIFNFVFAANLISVSFYMPIGFALVPVVAFCPIGVWGLFVGGCSDLNGCFINPLFDVYSNQKFFRLLMLMWAVGLVMVFSIIYINPQ